MKLRSIKAEALNGAIPDGLELDHRPVKALAWAEYQRVEDLAWAEYQRVEDLAWAEYQRVEDLSHKAICPTPDCPWDGKTIFGGE